MFLRSAGRRFAVLYALMFGLSSCILAFSLWYSTIGLVQRQVEGAIRSDVATLTALAAAPSGGLAALQGAIAERLTAPADLGGIYLLTDDQGRRISGNLDAWPKSLTQMDAWYQLPVSRAGHASVALLRAEALPGGAKLIVGRDVEVRAELWHVLRNGLIWTGFLMVILGLLGAVVIRSMFRRMIRDISITSRAIAKGDLSRRLPLGVGEEFDELAVIINDMLDRISRLMDGVRQVSNAIAHDLRTPVTRARTRLEDASLHASTPEELRAAIDRAILDLDGIVGVFEALLRIAEIEAGSRRAAFALVDLTQTLWDMDELYRAVAEERGLHLRTIIAAPLPVLGDRELLQQAIANLLDNALKFSASGMVIDLSAQLEDNVVEIVVADRGPGIAPGDRKRATERFYRGEAARSTGGSGLGLALVSAVAQLHNGTLQLCDNQPGLRAVISLPTQG
ncbi:HAMP domain-containing sensor histidine kinase [Acidocella sp.]|uniref:sensor histidine kinase n=1 Tax=Acidocella sp. TaxID=50710 RepID=UPI00263255F1|nr:HAMP domain-containing sensor histidine kinase [Acidocella sp.]